jgi:hypothetical protein
MNMSLYYLLVFLEITKATHIVNVSWVETSSHLNIEKSSRWIKGVRAQKYRRQMPREVNIDFWQGALNRAGRVIPIEVNEVKKVSYFLYPRLQSSMRQTLRIRVCTGVKYFENLEYFLEH